MLEGITLQNQQKKVMIVDDSEIVLAVAQQALESAGYAVITHPRPAGCIALILQEAPDLLLIDVNMPGLNGDTVVKMLGATQSNGNMIILLFSSLQAEVLEQKARASHAHGYIRKSEGAMDLVRQVARWIRPSAASGAHKFSLDTKLARESDSRLTISGGGAALAREGSDSRLRVAAAAALAREGCNSQLRMTAAATARGKTSGRILLVDHEMVILSELRRLVISHPGPVEFALSGAEVLRRLQGGSPPDVVVLGTLIEPLDTAALLHEANRLSSRWKTRFILLHDGVPDPRTHLLGNTRLQRPITEEALCDAIQDCMECAS